MKAKSAAALLREARSLETEEAAIKRRRLALAKQLIEAGHALGGYDSAREPVKPKRRYRRRRTSHTHTIAPAAPAPQASARKSKSGGWVPTMLDILVRANRPMAYADVKDAISKTHLGPTLARSDKGFYGSIAKLVARKQIIREGGRLFTPAVYEQFKKDVAAGLATDEPINNTGGNHTSPRRDAILDLLRANPRGVRTSEIVERLARMPELKLSDKNSVTAVYNLIARLVKRQVLLKDGSVVRLPHHHTNGVSPTTGAAGSRATEEELPLH